MYAEIIVVVAVVYRKIGHSLVWYDEGASIVLAWLTYYGAALAALTTIGGLLPLTLMDSSMWTPLGLVIIGGMLGSTVVTLFIVPVLYLLLTRKDPADIVIDSSELAQSHS